MKSLHLINKATGEPAEADPIYIADADYAFMLLAAKLHTPMLALLKELEWLELDTSGSEEFIGCACCHRYVGTNNDHAPDCKLAAILKAAEAGGEG